MNIYSQKQRWKILLFIAAIVIVAISLWYTNIMVNRLAQDEREKVKRWAEVIQKKADLVNYTNSLFEKIRLDERKKVELWAEATKQLNSATLNDYSFVLKVVTDNTSVPVILCDENNKVIAFRNLDSGQVSIPGYIEDELESMKKQYPPIEISVLQNKKDYLYYKDSKLFTELQVMFDGLINAFNSEVASNTANVPVVFTDESKKRIIAIGNIDSSRVNSEEKLTATIKQMELENPPIEVNLSGQGKSYIFHEDSFLLTQLKYFPYAQFGVIGLFLLISYILFSTARKSEQNQVWVGMAKETAHQLGTPLSSLMAWIELLKARGVDHETIFEMDKDLRRLGTITERFSKIGSEPRLDKCNVVKVMDDAINYLRTRTSKNVVYEIKSGGASEVMAQMNVPLFDWVIENLCKNSVDAMEGEGGRIEVDIQDQTQFVYIDITDTGKGLPKSKYKTIFEPGFTTKKRGWGLGLSLAKRIIENYHSGSIFVKRSEIDKGTTFRIVLNK